MNMLQIFKVGDEIGGYCNGYFGRDYYEDRICTFVAIDYAVFEDIDGHGTILSYREGLEGDVDQWFGDFGNVE